MEKVYILLATLVLTSCSFFNKKDTVAPNATSLALVIGNPVDLDWIA